MFRVWWHGSPTMPSVCPVTSSMTSSWSWRRTQRTRSGSSTQGRCPPESSNLQCRSQTAVRWLRSAVVNPTHSFNKLQGILYVQYLHASLTELICHCTPWVTLYLSSITGLFIHVELFLGYVVCDRILGHQFYKRIESFALSYSQSRLLTDFKENHTLLWF